VNSDRRTNNPRPRDLYSLTFSTPNQEASRDCWQILVWCQVSSHSDRCWYNCI